MIIMFGVFAFLFFQDGMWGYREKNLQYFMHQTFKDAETKFNQQVKEGGVDAASWKSFAAEQHCAQPESGGDILPREFSGEQPWPEILVNGFDALSKGRQTAKFPPLWEEYTLAEGMDLELDEHGVFEEGKIKEQFYAMTVCLVLIAITLFFLIRTMLRTIEIDDEALYDQLGRRILFSNITKIDKRKWDTKGMAYVYFTQDGKEETAKIDGLVYGQFKEENGAPAEQLFAKLLANFKGEIIEYVDDDEDSEEDLSVDSVKTDA